VHQFLVVLANTDQLVWRRIQVPESYSFWDLHVAIQDAMGWLACHLHEFRVVIESTAGRVQRFGIPVDESLEQPPVRPDWTVKVSSVVGKADLPMLYVYDFGDGWHHVVMHEGGVQRQRSVRAGPAMLEASWFRGREPDENRWDLDLARPDSWAVRGSWSAGPWSAQVSGGHFTRPEAFEPFDVDKINASV